MQDIQQIATLGRAFGNHLKCERHLHAEAVASGPRSSTRATIRCTDTVWGGLMSRGDVNK